MAKKSNKKNKKQPQRGTKNAKLELYQMLTKKITEGTGLNATELKTFNKLDAELNPDENGAAPAKIIDTLDQAARHCGVSKQTIRVWITKGHISQNTDGTFDAELLDAYLAKKSKKKKGPGTPEKIARADLRYRLARAKREELLVSQLKKKLISWAEIETEWAYRVSTVTSGLEALIDRIPPLVVGKDRDEVREILKREVREFRLSFVRHGKYCPDTEVTSGGD